MSNNMREMRIAVDEDSTIQYIDCTPDDLISGVKLENIIGFVIQENGFKLKQLLNSRPDSNHYESNWTRWIRLTVLNIYETVFRLKQSSSISLLFWQFCSALEDKLGCAEKCQKNRELDQIGLDAVVNVLRELLPNRVPEFDRIITDIADSVTESLQRGPRAFWTSKSTGWINFDERIIIRIYRSGVNLAIVPSYMKIRGYKKEHSYFYSQAVTNSKLEFEYEQCKFEMNKSEIDRLLEKKQQDAVI